jgi:hypothetical protein
VHVVGAGRLQQPLDAGNRLRRRDDERAIRLDKVVLHIHHHDGRARRGQLNLIGEQDLGNLHHVAGNES